ncbi:MAG TPA: hypothetical protein VM095_04480 [Pyrinomonadaceae bacterium]|nr:hypothetical protein [Pyrinomonadaceae bacterium]
MNRKVSLFIATLLISSVCAVSVCAQRRQGTGTPPPPARQSGATEASPQKEASQVSTESADVAITATVTAKELRFEIVPNPTVEFPGKPRRDTVWEAERENLPRPLEPGVTYRNIGIRLRIVSRFADIERIVAEALGEAPVTDETPPVEKTTPQTNASPPLPATSTQPNGGTLK